LHKLLLDIPTHLETEKLMIRKYAKGDGRDLYLLLERNGNRDFLKENVEEISSIKTDEEAEIEIRKHAAEWNTRDRFVMGIWLKSENKYIGEIWIEPKNIGKSLHLRSDGSWIEAIKERESQLKLLDVH